MLVSDIRKMKDGKPFKVFPGVGVPAVHYRYADYQIFLRYFELYATSKRWGLPNGNGWANESVICMKILMHFDELQDKIDVWRMEQSSKSKP